jgi:DNA-directed RNA polymerase subunit RPC12/RpoP
MCFVLTSHSGAGRQSRRILLAGFILASWLGVAGCGKDAATEASDSDANGYLCAKCGAKFYTDRSVFLTLKCPKCQQEGLVQVVGYVCAKDNHVTVMGRNDDRSGTTACEKCGGPLGAMRLPREKDLRAWGATQAPK